jgi:mRNA interferase MazF
MEKFVKGDVVVIPFPFSDLSQAKRRPALVMANLEGDDVILCQITSRSVEDIYAIPLLDDDFESGGLQRTSNIRPNRIFFADTRIILYKAGRVKGSKVSEVIDRIVSILVNESGRN